MLRKLRDLQASGERIRVGIVGCGAMGLGVARQVLRTPGMDLVFVADHRPENLERAVRATGLPARNVDAVGTPAVRRGGELLSTLDTKKLLREVKIDALVECTNSIFDAAEYCLAAIAQKAHVVLMNAEVDLVFGTLLAHEAARSGVVVTSDAGDQHGVLATMADEIQLWGFRIVQAGNMKGFLNRHATAATSQEWADKQRLSVVQTVSYTDGSKMNLEQALIGNYLGLTPIVPGMEGPKCGDVRDVLTAFNFEKYGDQGRVDYTVGVPWPGGGVYIVGYCDDDQQDFLLRYYKVTCRRPYYLFFRPYHLCHIETPRAIAQAYFDHRPVIPPPLGRKTNDVYAYAKQDLRAGQTIHHAMGGDEIYGLVDACASAEPAGAVPIGQFVPCDDQHVVLKRPKKKDDRLNFADLEIPDTRLHQMLARQQALIAS